MSKDLDAARERANAAFDEHCEAWRNLQSIQPPSSSMREYERRLEAWVVAKEKARVAQGEFETKLREWWRNPGHEHRG